MPTLVIDSASRRTLIELRPSRHRPPSAVWHGDGDAGRSLFAGLHATLASTGTRWDDIDSILFCEGPGSLLGLRTAAMAIRTWLALRSAERQPPLSTLAFRSLHHLALREINAGRTTPFEIILPAGRDGWHRLVVGSPHEALGDISRVPSPLPDPARGTSRLLPSGFKVWTPAPGAQEVPYDLAGLASAPDAAFLPSPLPAPWPPSAPSFVKWNPPPGVPPPPPLP